MSFVNSEIKVLYNGGTQNFTILPIDAQGRPALCSSATYVIEDLRRSESSSDRTIQTSTAATVDSVSLSTTAAVGPDSAYIRTIPLDATTGLDEGVPYILHRSDGGAGERELVICEGFGGSLMRLRNDLMRSFASGASLKGCLLTCSFPAATANSESLFNDGGGPYRVRVTATIDGKTDYFDRIVWVVRTRAKPSVSTADVLLIDPALAGRVGESNQLEAYIEAASLDYFGDVRKAGFDEDYYMSPEGQRAIVFRAAWYARMGFRTDRDTAMAEIWSEEYRRRVVNEFAGMPPVGIVRTNRENDDAAAGKPQPYVNPFVRS